ncbi:hypothetical protein [Streptomyces sp. 039-1]|uniref:hypothetical protein n=1 Tax=Streptomyces sp. 039-1 TaxID=2789263 RepID=UPI0039F5C832
MPKAGASGPKRRARKAQRATGMRYTQLRQSTTPPRPRCQVVQFLHENHYNLRPLAARFAAAWARQEQRVLLLQEYQPSSEGLALVSRRDSVRKAAEGRARQWPGPHSAVLWQATDVQGTGVLVEQHTPWQARLRDPRLLTYDDSPLRDAVRQGRAHFDVVVLAGSPNWPRTAHVDDFIVLAPTDGVPLVESHSYLPGTETPVAEYPLTPEQSAALLRDRHLQFLHTKPPSFAGLVTAGRTAIQPDPASLRAVQANMADVGIPLLGHVQHSRHGQSSHEEPLDGQLRTVPADDEGIKETARVLLERWRATP